MTVTDQQEQILNALRDARLKLAAHERAREEKVAVIGMAGRFPGADDLEQFWRMLAEGRSGIRSVSDDELRAAGVDPALFQRPDYVRAWAGIAEADAFDADFFGYAPREAEILDPQHRVFLECAWHALEDAGYDSARYGGRVGVYAAAALNTYLINLYSHAQLRASTDTVQAVVGNVLGLMPTRVSYHLNLTGPSCGIQTGCSSSLVAVHTACRSLLAGECEMALAGGVTVGGEISPQGYPRRDGGIASPDGACRAFDADGRGTVFGQGVGIVVLKRLSAALADGDRILAVIRGSAVNNDGAGKVGLIAPSAAGQAAVIGEALKNAGIDAATLDYIEGHGTGTELGDPIEVAALNQVLRPAFAGSGRACRLGSVKTNLGHLDAAAGIAGLIKTVLALQYRSIPPSLNFKQASPNIDFGGGPLRVVTEATPWPETDHPRRAGVSSFGMGGTNAHVIVEEAPDSAPDYALPSRDWQLLPLSARTDSALWALERALRDSLGRPQAPPLADAAKTLQLGRRQLKKRTVLLAQAAADGELHFPEGGQRFEGDAGERGPLVFAFPGQGSQYPGMASRLYRGEPAFRQALDECAASAPAELGLLALMLGDRDDTAAEQRLRQTEYAQPALFAMEYALARLWQAWGVEADLLIGHSVGEYVAACLAGVFTLPDALRLVIRRGALMQQCRPGAMLAVALNETELREAMPAALDLAAVNGPAQCVVAGETADLQAFQAELERRGIACHRLGTSHAFHSRAMEPILAAFGEALSSVPMRAPQIDIVSNLDGRRLSPEQARDPAYWMRHLRRAVRFGDGLSTIFSDSAAVILEVGPGQTLTRLARTQATSGALLLASLADADEHRALAAALAQMWCRGVEVDWPAYGERRPGRRTSLPVYPFERKRYWIERNATLEAARDRNEAPDTAPAGPEDWFYHAGWRADSDEPAAAVSGTWVVFADADCRNRLEPHLAGVEIIWVYAGDGFAADRNHYTIAPDAESDYRRLGEALAASGCRVGQWLYAWPALADANADSELSRLLALLRTAAGRPALVSMLSVGAWRLAAAEKRAPVASALNGILQVAGQEYDGLHTRQIDLETGPAGLPGHDLALLSETLKQEIAETAVSLMLRAGVRWRREYRPLRLPSVEADSSLLRRNGVYLICGDLADGLGMVFAKGLWRHWRARLLLVGDAGLPGRDAWEHWLATHGPLHPVTIMIRTLQGLAQEGADFGYVRADLREPAGLAKALAEAGTRVAEIEGVFHVEAMGDKSACALAAANAFEIERIFSSRVNVFRQLLAEPALNRCRFAMLQSSLSVAVGGQGFALYAAASAMLDALANGQRSDVAWFSAAWDAVDNNTFDGDAGGAAVGSELMAGALTPEQAWRAAERLLAQPRAGTILVTPRPLQPRLRQAFAARQALPLDTNVAATVHGRPALATAYRAPETETERLVAAAMGELLGIGQVGMDDDFFELGGHSLLAIQAVTRLRKEFGVELPMRALLFEARTPAGIAVVIERNRAEQATADEDLARLLAEVENLSAEEVQAQLQQD